MNLGLKNQLITYVEDVLKPYEVESIELYDELALDVYLVEMEDGQEYWLLYDQGVVGLYRKTGIFNDLDHVLEIQAEYEKHS